MKLNTKMGRVSIFIKKPTQNQQFVVGIGWKIDHSQRNIIQKMVKNLKIAIDTSKIVKDSTKTVRRTVFGNQSKATFSLKFNFFFSFHPINHAFNFHFRNPSAAVESK